MVHRMGSPRERAGGGGTSDVAEGKEADTQSMERGKHVSVGTGTNVQTDVGPQF